MYTKKEKNYMKKNIINNEAWFPEYNHKTEHIYILLTSLNLGGAEKIVSDQLWANYYQKFPQKVTLIVIYDKQKEHSIPPNINIIRLNNNIENGEVIFKQIAFENNPLVCHLINDKMAEYLFSLQLNIHIVIHNDKKGWSNTELIFNHPQLISLISVCKYVTKQLTEVTKKPIFTLRHQISERQYQFKENLRTYYRNELKLTNDDILIGMTGRICLQKNYFLALDVIAQLSRKNPKYKLIILGGFEPSNSFVYFNLLKKATLLNIQNNIFLPGFKDNAFDWINTFDIGLNVSHFEGLSMATQELIMNGLPVVLSKVSGQSEILDLQKQLKFFELPENLNHTDTQYLNIDLNIDDVFSDKQNDLNDYKNLVNNISNLIEKNHSTRISLTENEQNDLNKIRYGSHNIWSLFNFIIKKNNCTIIKPAFLTSNLNLGGAQRSLVNLIMELKNNKIEIPLIMLNQSNYTGFYKKILDAKIESFLCHSHYDVFSIMNSLLNYLYKNEINRIILWNVDSKIKLLLSKLVGHNIDIIDVSPGDYCFVEMDEQILFQEAIYYNKNEYFSNIYKFVSKFDNTHLEQPYKKLLKNETVIIPNGVPIEIEFIKEQNNFLFDNKNPFKFVVCGRITESKHIHIILEAFERLYDKYQYISIDFYGSAETYNIDYYNELLNKFKLLIDMNIVRFCGNIDDPKTIMKNYHSIIVLGTHQGSPNVVLEAVSCKLPCIANDSGGTKEIINNETGLLLPPVPEVETLFNAMNFSLNNYNEIWIKNENAFKLVTEKFSMKAMKEKYLGVIYG